MASLSPSPSTVGSKNAGRSRTTRWLQIRVLVGAVILAILSIINQLSPEIFEGNFRFQVPFPPVAHAAQLPEKSLDTSTADSLIPSDAQNLLRRNAFSIAGRSVVIITAASQDVAKFISNLKCFTDQTTQKPVTLFSLDSNMSTYAKEREISTIEWYSTSLKLENEALAKKPIPGKDRVIPHLFGSQRFSSITLTKLDIVRQVLRMGLDVIFTDVDIVWCRNIADEFAHYIAKYPLYDSFMQSNTQNASQIGQLNTGFYYMKSTPKTLILYDGLVEQSSNWYNRSGDDQTLFWGYVCSGGRKRAMNGVIELSENMTNVKEPQFLCQWNDSSVQILFLPTSQFPNGALDPEGRNLGKVPMKYYRGACQQKKVAIWHINYCRGDAKEMRLRQQDVWLSNENNTCDTI